MSSMQNERGLNGLAEQIHETAVSKGWWDPNRQRSTGELLMLIVDEVAEAHEEYRNGHPIGLIQYEHPSGERSFSPEDDERNPSKPVGFASELADILIRTLDLAEACGIDIEAAVRIKMDFNTTRPHRHGGKLA